MLSWCFWDVLENSARLGLIGTKLAFMFSLAALHSSVCGLCPGQEHETCSKEWICLFWFRSRISIVSHLPRHTERCWQSSQHPISLIARNQGHFEPANNYQRYIVLHSGTIEYQENSICRRSRLDLQRRVFRTMTYTIWAPQIFYLMKRKRKEDLQVNLWDFSRLIWGGI